MKINLFFGSYSLIDDCVIDISRSQANAGKITSVTIDSTHNWTIPSSIPTSKYGYIIYSLMSRADFDANGNEIFDGYHGIDQVVYIPPKSTRTIKYLSSEALSIDGKKFYCPDANAEWVGTCILVPATTSMITYVWLLDTPVTVNDVTFDGGGTIFAEEYGMRTDLSGTNVYRLIIDNDAYPNRVPYTIDSMPGYTYQGGLSIYYSEGHEIRLKAGSHRHHASGTVYTSHLNILGGQFYICPFYAKTYAAPTLDTGTLVVDSDGSVSWSCSLLIDIDSVKDNQPTSCKMKLISDGVSSAYFTPSNYTKESVSSTKARVTYSGTAESGTIYDSSNKVMTFDPSIDAKCTIVFKDAANFTESTLNASIRYVGTHPAFTVSNKCQSVGIFKRPDKDSSGNVKTGLTIGDSTYIHTSKHQAMTVTGENSDVGTMIDIYNSDASDNTVSIGIGIGGGHVNRGIYDNTLGGWSVSTQSDKALHLGTANTGGVISDKSLTVKGNTTITGNTFVTNGNVHLSTSGTNHIVINQTAQNYNDYSSSSTYCWMLQHQSNGKTTAYIEHERTSAGNDNISVIAKHYTSDSASVINKLVVGRSASANTYAVTDTSAFRAAIGANNAANINTGNLSYERIRSVLQTGQTASYPGSATIKTWHASAGYVTVYMYGSICIINAFQVEVSATKTWETITQLAVGCRPKYSVRAPLAAAGTPSYNGGVMQVNTSGYVQLYNPESATGNLMMSGSLSFIMAQ